MIKETDLQILRKFLEGLLRESGSIKEFSDDQSLILSHGLDSLAVTRLILFLEEEYELDLDGKVHDISDLDSFSKIAKLIRSK